MIRIILCEGETDAVLLGYYLHKLEGWNYCSKSKFLPIQFSQQDNRCLLPYRNDIGEELLICGVGGKDGFGQFFAEQIFSPIWLSHQAEKDFRIAVVTDRDNLSIEEIEKNIARQFIDSQIPLKDNCWQRTTMHNSFGTEVIIDSLLVVIPREKAGALEHLLMESLSENEYDANVVRRCEEFVSAVADEVEQYVPTERLRVKAQLGVVLSIMNPERIFSLFDEYIRSVKWEESQTLKECFCELIKI